MRGAARDLPTGVYARGRKYFAAIAIDRRYVHLGSFSAVEEASAAYLKAKADVAAGVHVVGPKIRAETEAGRFAAAAARKARWAAHEARRGLPKHVYAKGRKYLALIWDRVQSRIVRLGTFDTAEKARKAVERAKKRTRQ